MADVESVEELPKLLFVELVGLESHGNSHPLHELLFVNASVSVGVEGIEELLC